MELKAIELEYSTHYVVHGIGNTLWGGHFWTAGEFGTSLGGAALRQSPCLITCMCILLLPFA